LQIYARELPDDAVKQKTDSQSQEQTENKRATLGEPKSITNQSQN
jgi:hypothetical protein